MALANGAAELITVVTAGGGEDEGGFSLAVGSLFGAGNNIIILNLILKYIGIFITTVIFAKTILAAKN